MNLTTPIKNEILKWTSGVLTTMGIAVLILSIVRPLIQPSSSPDYALGLVGFFRLL